MTQMTSMHDKHLGTVALFFVLGKSQHLPKPPELEGQRVSRSSQKMLVWTKATFFPPLEMPESGQDDLRIDFVVVDETGFDGSRFDASVVVGDRTGSLWVATFDRRTLLGASLDASFICAISAAWASCFSLMEAICERRSSMSVSRQRRWSRSRHTSHLRVDSIPHAVRRRHDFLLPSSQSNVLAAYLRDR